MDILAKIAGWQPQSVPQYPIAGIEVNDSGNDLWSELFALSMVNQKRDLVIAAREAGARITTNSSSYHLELELSDGYPQLSLAAVYEMVEPEELPA